MLAVATLRRRADANLGTKDELWEVVIDLGEGACAEAIRALVEGVSLGCYDLMRQGAEYRSATVPVARER